MYRVIVDEDGRIRLPEELLAVLDVQRGTVFLCRNDKGTLMLEKEDIETKPERVEGEVIQTDLFWLPAEIAYYPDKVRVRCKEPHIEVWASDRESGMRKFAEEANKLYR